jgi:hypothetical protein
MEWMVYLLANSTLLSDDEYLAMTKGDIYDAWSETTVKYELFEYMGYFPLVDEIIEKHLASIYEKAGQKQPDAEALAKMVRQVKEKHVEWYIGLTNLARKERKQALEEVGKMKYKSTPWHEVPKFPPLVIPPGTTDKEHCRLSEKHIMEELAHQIKHENPAIKRHERLRQRILQRASWRDVDRDYNMRQFVFTLVMTFPRDGAKVRECLRKAGYSTDEECAKAIATIFPMTKETAFLYEGLKLQKTKGKK